MLKAAAFPICGRTLASDHRVEVCAQAVTRVGGRGIRIVAVLVDPGSKLSLLW